MQLTRWWQSGLLGGVGLSVATFIKVIRAVIRGATGEADWIEATGFAVAIFAIGFVCGVIVWAGRGLSRRFGLVGDAVIGMVVMVVFFLACMLLSEPELLQEKLWYGGLPMLGLAVVLGLVGGAWIGRDLRKQWAQEQQSGTSEPSKTLSRDLPNGVYCSHCGRLDGDLLRRGYCLQCKQDV